MSITFTDEMYRVDQVKDLLWKQLDNNSRGSARFYAVLYYGKSYTGGTLPSSIYHRRWKIDEVKKTHSFIKKQLNKRFGDGLPLWFFLERHKPRKDPFGNIRLGSYHTNLYIGDINLPDDIAIKELDKTLRLAKWVGQHENSCVVEAIPPEEMEQTFMYSLKDINNSMDGFDFLVDWYNSDFLYKYQ
jgi:hypothetical protein